jgi:class 3 adenylate cyclase
MRSTSPSESHRRGWWSLTATTTNGSPATPTAYSTRSSRFSPADAALRQPAECYRVVERQVARARGTVVKFTGDGVLATFDGPARAINCACAIRDAVANLGLQIRAGLHTGEVEMVDGDVHGIAVHIAARITALAAPNEVLVSGAIPPLVLGSGLAFDDHGSHELKGVPDAWPVLAVHEAD